MLLRTCPTKAACYNCTFIYYFYDSYEFVKLFLPFLRIFNDDIFLNLATLKLAAMSPYAAIEVIFIQLSTSAVTCVSFILDLRWRFHSSFQRVVYSLIISLLPTTTNVKVLFLCF